MALSETVLNALARATKFTKRSGKIPADGFLNALLASENDQAPTSLPDLASGLRQAHSIEVSKEAMHKKFTPEAVDFLESVLNNLLSYHLAQVSRPVLAFYLFVRISLQLKTIAPGKCWVFVG